MDQISRNILKKTLTFLCLAFMSASPAFASQHWTVQETSVDQILHDPKIVSAAGKPLIVYRLKKGKGVGHRFLIQGGLHGNEHQTSIFVLWLKDRLEADIGPLAELPEGSVVDFLPFANPDSYGSSRYNKNAINLNRNFSILWGISREPNGSKPHSEPETIAITHLMQHEKYNAAIDVHGYVNWVVAPSQPQFVPNANPRMQALYWAWTNHLHQEVAKLPNYILKTAGTLGDGGAFEDWAFWANGTLSFCLELSSEMKTAGRPADYYNRYESFVAQMFQKALAIDHLEEEAVAQNHVPIQTTSKGIDELAPNIQLNTYKPSF